MLKNILPKTTPLKITLVIILLLVATLFVSSINLITTKNKTHLNDIAISSYEKEQLSESSFNLVKNNFNSFSLNENNKHEGFTKLNLKEWMDKADGMCDREGYNFSFCNRIELDFDHYNTNQYIVGENNIDEYSVYLNKQDFELYIIHNDEILYSILKNNFKNKDTFDSVIKNPPNKYHDETYNGLKYENYIYQKTTRPEMITYRLIDNTFMQLFFHFINSSEFYKDNHDLTAFESEKYTYVKLIDYYFNDDYIIYSKAPYSNQLVIDLFKNPNKSVATKIKHKAVLFFGKLGLIQFSDS